MLYRWLLNYDRDNPAFNEMYRVAKISMIALVAISCVSFDWPMRCVVLIAAVTLGSDWKYTQFKNGFGDLAIFANVHLLLAVAALGGSRGLIIPGFIDSLTGASLAYLLLTCALSAVCFDAASRFGWMQKHLVSQRTIAWSMTLKGFCVALTIMCFGVHDFEFLSVALVTVALSVLVVTELSLAIRRQAELHVWIAIGIVLAISGFLFKEKAISFGIGMSQFVLLGIGVGSLCITALSSHYQKLRVFDSPLNLIGHSMPAVVAGLAVVREFTDLFSASSTTLNALALMMAAGIYFHQAYATQLHRFFVAGTVIANVGLVFLWSSLGWMAAELYLVPVGLSLLALVELMKDRLPAASHNPLRYIAVLTIMCSPLFEILSGSWVHMLSLMLLSVTVILIAIGLRLRSLVYAGSAFLATDLIAMVIRSVDHNLTLLWIGGVVLGIAVIVLAAFCENHRDKLLSRIRILSAELATWN